LDRAFLTGVGFADFGVFFIDGMRACNQGRDNQNGTHNKFRHVVIFSMSVFQRRWLLFAGNNLIYNTDQVKSMPSIPLLSCILILKLSCIMNKLKYYVPSFQ
jgi:hypothetical protein